ncbi:MAG: ABC transporter permease, partial [Planctomycetota bacterium]
SAIGLASWESKPELFNYDQRLTAGEIEGPVYTLVPWSPAQQFNDRKTDRLGPAATVTGALSNSLTVGLDPTGELTGDGLAQIRSGIEKLPIAQTERTALLEAVDNGLVTTGMVTLDAEEALRDELAPLGFSFPLGTDGQGQDVLSQLIHASRLAISIGLVSTGIAVVIGVTLGALMGYFGGIVDMLLYRVVEIFMAVPVLFILIVAAGLLENPSTYVMMVIIGCFTWHSAARFVRAEFFKLRDQDFVQSAKAVGLPLRSILFKHMLPNGVTPVLVDASFAIALAIHFEATLSFLGLGPQDQASWGGMLADATGDSGDFKWWLAVFPGGAIFLTALAYNLMGEALRDAIDPKLKKARV